MTPVILIHYHEIALKGKNRLFFENKLIENLKKTVGIKEIRGEFGQILIPLEKEIQFEKLKNRLALVPGIANFSLAWETKKEIKTIKKHLDSQIKGKKFSSFRVVAHRTDKNFELTSPEINKIIGQWVAERTKAKVNLDKPKFSIFIKIGMKKALFYFEKTSGIGGLPVSTAGKLLCLFSGGIDSPVAAFQMIKRGSQVNFIHFHSYPQINKKSLEKCKKLAAVLNQFQFKTSFFSTPFLSFQKECFKKCSHRTLVVLYRRGMLAIARRIAEKENYLGLITGDSLGQVASQTLENMLATSFSTSLPIYRPLISWDKQEIIDLAKKIKTYSLSIQPHQDCCSLFVPKHPTTKANLGMILEEEKKINAEKLIQDALQKTEKMEITDRTTAHKVV